LMMGTKEWLWIAFAVYCGPGTYQEDIAIDNSEPRPT